MSEFNARPLGELIRIRKGKKPVSVSQRQQNEAQRPYLLIDSFGGEYKSFTDDTSCPYVKADETLLVWDGERCGLTSTGHEGYVGSTLAAICATAEVLEHNYLFHFLAGKQREIRNSAEGTGVPHVSRRFLEELEIALPPLPEQKKIAVILSEIDNHIKQLRIKREKVKLVKSATSLQIFKSLSSSAPTATETSSLQSLASMPISYGVLVPDSATRDDGVPMIKIQDINQGKIQTHKLSYISRSLHGKYAKTEVKTGDLLISLIGSIGITAKVPDTLEGANVSRQFAVIRTPTQEMSDYLHCFLRGGTAQEKISFLSQGNAQKALNLDSLRELEVPLKSNEVMDRIVRIHKALDSSIETISKRIEKQKNIRHSVASDLLSGRKRVTL